MILKNKTGNISLEISSKIQENDENLKTKQTNKKHLVDICMFNQSKRDYKIVTDKDIFMPDIPDKI